MASRTGRRIRRRFKAVCRVTACLLVALIAADLATDAQCDGVRLSAGESVARSVPSRTADACDTLCVPDCFCCARSLAAGAAAVPPHPGPLTQSLVTVAASGSPGVRPVADPPPLLS